MDNINIMTIGKLREVIREVPEIFIRPRFGVSERWMRISKREALALIRGYKDDVTADDLEMESLGHHYGAVPTVLYLG